ncbi:MAG TPA: CHASE domain-containing protein [Burkholderiaceae bacterium]|nr:CHASE domain-containing protein [Burkholderiaceae bacterium]
MAAATTPVRVDPAATPPPRWPAWWRFALALLAYALIARLSLLIAIQPSNASPLYPAAGFAMAAVLAWGRPVLWAIPLAATAANLAQLSSVQTLTLGTAAIWAGTGVGAALQAAFGAWLMRRMLQAPIVLSEPADLMRFMLLVAPLACLTSATVACAVLVASGVLSMDAVPLSWAFWWIGDTLGVLIGTPVTLALIGHPASEWRPRRWSVALPLAIVTLLMGLGVHETQRADAQLARQAFEREARAVANTVAQGAQAPALALEALRGVVDTAPALDRDAFRRSAAAWLAQGGGLVAIGYAERVARRDLAAFEAREQASGRPGFRVFDRSDAGVPQPDEDHVLAIRFIEPEAANARALGVNSRSVRLAREAIDRSMRTGRASVTAGFALTQGGRGVVMYQAVGGNGPDGVRGVVFVTVRSDEVVRAADTRPPTRLSTCVLDRQAPATDPPLAGDARCQRLAPDQPLVTQVIDVADRAWEVRVFADRLQPQGLGRAWPFALVGLASTALLGALLLTITGRARRIEAAVAERTAELEQRRAELQEEVQQRQRTSQALRDSQQRLRNILDNASIGVAYTDGEGRIREANPRLREMLGSSVERLSGLPIGHLLHPEDRAAEAQVRERLLAGEVQVARAQLRCVTSDHQTLWTRASVSMLRTAQGQPRRMVWVIEDITEHLALEEAQRARKGAEAANLAKNEFLSRMSHELRTPLNAVLGFTQLLELDRRQPLAPHQLEWTQQMRQAGWHLLHMINDTLDLSRIESGHVDLRTEALDLRAVVDAARSLVDQAAHKRGITVEVHLGEGASVAMGDATRVKQVLANLLSNAVKYNRPAGQVVVASHRTDAGQVAIEVIDTGNGLSGDQIGQLFQPFNRLGQEGGSIEGTGIGLVISRRLAELMNGSLLVRSTPGMGSTFTLELPAAPHESVAAHDESEGDTLASAPYRRRLVHYIDDNETNVEVMRGILALRPQIRLDVSTLGLPGLQAVRHTQPSLVLLDMHLPDVDGLEVLERLKSDPATADIPVVVVSADATPARISQAIQSGAAHYLTKPVNVADLLQSLDELLEDLDTHFG